MKNINQAVCSIIFNEKKEILVVTRRNSKEWSFVGGKVDVGETSEEAIKRETLEETGVIIDNLIPIFTGYCEGGGDGRAFWTTTYIALDVNLDNLKINEEKEKGIIPMWKNLEDFKESKFFEYNEKVLKNIEKMINSKDLYIK